MLKQTKFFEFTSLQVKALVMMKNQVQKYVKVLTEILMQKIEKLEIRSEIEVETSLIPLTRKEFEDD